MIDLMKKVLCFAVAATLLACSPSPAQQASAEPAARVGDRVITMKELEDRWSAADPSKHAETVQALYDGRRNALEAIVADMLIGEAAKSKGMSADAYAESEIARRVKPVTDADVVAFYQANVNQMQGRPLDAMAPAINRYLTDQQRAAAREALLAE